MHNTRTLIIIFPISNSILRPRITCEICITDIENYYELKYHLYVDGSRIVIEIDYDLSYAPVIDGNILILMIAVATSKKMLFYFLYISNTF